MATVRIYNTDGQFTLELINGPSQRKICTFNLSRIPADAVVTKVVARVGDAKIAGDGDYTTSGYCIVYPYGSSTNYGAFNDATVTKWINQYGLKNLTASLGAYCNSGNRCGVRFNPYIEITYDTPEPPAVESSVVYYGTANGWSETCHVFYGVDGKWIQCNVRYGQNGVWQDNIETK